MLDRHRRALYCSFHTTAGYLDQSLSARMHHRQDLLSQFFRAFHALFPQGGEYHHDRMELRSELTDEQKVVEPRNADSHLTYIGSGMRNCVTYRTRPDAPVYFIELDGMTDAIGAAAHHQDRRLRRGARRRARVGARAGLEAPGGLDQPRRSASRPARFGQRAAARSTACSYGRVDLVVDPTERNVGLTVNEYETLLMQNDLADVLRDPLRFARAQGTQRAARSALDPRQDAQLRQVRRRPRAQLADGGAAARRGVVRAADRQGDVAAGPPVPALAPGQLPRGRRRARNGGALAARDLSEPDPGAMAEPGAARSAASISCSRSCRSPARRTERRAELRVSSVKNKRQGITPLCVRSAVS